MPGGTPTAVRSDFNGDGKPDYVILYNASTRRTAVWYLNNNVFLGSAYGPTLPAGWTLVDTADFNRNGRALITHSSHPAARARQGSGISSESRFAEAPLARPCPAAGHWWRSATLTATASPTMYSYNARTHQTAVWYMNNNVLVSGAFGPTLPGAWSLAGVADFNRSGTRLITHSSIPARARQRSGISLE